MSQEERFGTRDRSYSAWHRRMSTRRYVGIESAQTLAMIDLDASLYVEYDDGTKEPLALIETAKDVGQDFKTATVTKKLAIRANLPAFVLLYTLADYPNPADIHILDIHGFRVKRLNPPHPAQMDWLRVTPEKWCKYLVALRQQEAAKLDALLDFESC